MRRAGCIPRSGLATAIAVLLLIALWAAPASADGTGAPPSPPLGLVAFYGNDATIVLMWQPPLDDGGSNVTEYRVYRTDSTSNISATSLGATQGTTFADTNVAPGLATLYEYVVTAVNEFGESDPSNAAVASAGAGCIQIDLGTTPPTVDFTCVPPLPPPIVALGNELICLTPIRTSIMSC